MAEAADGRGEMIKLLDDPMTIAEELRDATTRLPDRACAR